MKTNIISLNFLNIFKIILNILLFKKLIKTMIGFLVKMLYNIIVIKIYY